MGNVIVRDPNYCKLPDGCAVSADRVFIHYDLPEFSRELQGPENYGAYDGNDDRILTISEVPAALDELPSGVRPGALMQPDYARFQRWIDKAPPGHLAIANNLSEATAIFIGRFGMGAINPTPRSGAPDGIVDKAIGGVLLFTVISLTIIFALRNRIRLS